MSKHKYSISTVANSLSHTNEDSAVASELTGFYMLCDGMGGLGRGDLASQVATGLIEQFAHTSSLETESTWPFEKKEGLSLEENYVRMLLLKINSKIIERAQHENKMGWMGCSGIVLLKLSEKIVIASVGNCRGYLFRKNQLIQLTQDHSLARHKKWIPIQPQQNIALNFLGKDTQMELDATAEKSPKKGDIYLLLSSGIMNSLSTEEIAHTISHHSSSMDKLSESLVKAAHQKNSHFDSTVLVLTV